MIEELKRKKRAFSKNDRNFFFENDSELFETNSKTKIRITKLSLFQSFQGLRNSLRKVCNG